MKILLKQNKILLIATIICNVITSLGFVFIAILLQKVLDAVIIKNMDEFFNLIAFSCGYMFLLGIFLYLESLLSKKVICLILEGLRISVFEGIINKDIESYNLNDTGDYLSLINNDVKLIEENFLIPLFEIIQYSIIFIASLGIMLYFDIIISVCIIISIMFMFIIPSLFGSKLEKRQDYFSQCLSKFTGDTKDVLSGFEVIKSYSITEYIISKYKKSNARVINAKYDVDKLMALNEGLSSTLALLVQIITVLLSAYFIITDRITVGVLIAMVQASSNLANPLLLIFSNIPKLKSVKSILEKIDTTSNLVDKNNNKKDVATFNKNITVRNLSFSYDNQKDILNDISVEISRKKKYLIVGKSGCGKSTLVKLIVGYYSNYNGNICYDNHDLRKLDIDSISNLSSIIHQNIFMFNENIYDNICLHESYLDSDIDDVLKKSGLSKFIEQTPDGLLYQVGENGDNLSGGQKQRIAVARALVRNKPLLILDEGTSSVDMQTAYDIESELLQLDELTLITISHNFKEELLKLYDYIIYMDDGKIVEQGPFDTIIKNTDFYNFISISSLTKN